MLDILYSWWLRLKFRYYLWKYRDMPSGRDEDTYIYDELPKDDEGDTNRF